MSVQPEKIEPCNGFGSLFEGFRDGCEDCVRRTMPREFGAATIEPTVLIIFECENRIEPDSK